MEDRIVQAIETLFHMKIMLYNDLLRALHRESELLVNIDLDRLWEISNEKEEICSEIESIRQEITFKIGPEADQKRFDMIGILGLIPRPLRMKFHELYRTIIKLKGEVEVLRKENMFFIDDSLSFLDEMISIITGDKKSGAIYNNRCHFSTSGSHNLLNREA